MLAHKHIHNPTRTHPLPPFPALASLRSAPTPTQPPVHLAFLGASSAKPAVCAWTWGRDTPLFRAALAEQMTSLATSPDGYLVAAGGVSGRVSVWEAGTGELLFSAPCHYKAVTALAFSPCGGVFASGGGDGVIHVWDVASLLGAEGGWDSPPTPAATWSDHALGVSSLRFCAGTGLRAPLLSTSADRTARLWDVASKSCLLRVTLPAPAHCAVADDFLHTLWVGCGDGLVYKVALHAAGAAGEGGSGLQLASPPPPGGGGGGGGDEEGGGLRCCVGHTGCVNTVLLSPTGGLLVSTSADGSCRVWDTATRSQLGLFEGHGSNAVVAALLRPAPPPGLRSSGSSSSRPTAALPQLAPLKKYALPGGGDPVLRCRFAGSLVTPDEAARANDAWVAAVAALEAGIAAAGGGGGEGGGEEGDAPRLRARVAELEGEVARWRAVNEGLMAKLEA